MSDESSNPFGIFPSESQIPVMGLSFLGHLTRDVNYCGHTWTIRTLRPSEKAAIALVTQKWLNTIAEAQVYANAHVGVAITAVDGNTEWYPPAGPDLDDWVRVRLQAVTDHQKGWHQATLDYLYLEWLDLEEKATDELDRLQNLSLRNRPTSTTSVDSLIAQATSLAQTDGDSPS